MNAAGVTVVDGALNYTPGLTALGIVGLAYTNNDLSANTATTLCALDSTLDQIALQSPPNSDQRGLLTAKRTSWPACPRRSRSCARA